LARLDGSPPILHDRQLMDALPEFDAALHRLLDASSDTVVLATVDGQILSGNHAARQMLGYSSEELPGLNWRDLTVDDNGLRAALAEPSRAGGQKITVVVVRKGGERIEAELMSAEFRSPSGVPRVWTIIHDLSGRKRAEDTARALRESEETFRALAEASFEGIFLQREGRILLANAAVERMHGLPRGGLIGVHILDCVAPEARDDIKQRVATLSEEPYETIGVRRDGTRFFAEVQARTGPVNFRGEPTRVVAVRDVTARKQLEAKLALSDRMASLGTLAAGVAHEINNPLTALMLSIDLAHEELARGRDARIARIAELLETAGESAVRVQRIVKDLRSLARSEDEPSAQIDLAEVIAYAHGIASYQIRHHARVEVRIAPLGPVYGDRARLEQVVLNLLVNAAQAIPNDGAEHRIAIDVREHGADRFAIEVRDTGVGIAPELRARIFDPFVTTKPIGEGTGLGLSICHTIVASLGGTIDVESEVGKGTTFRIVLPRGSAPTPALAVTPPAGVAVAASTVRRGRILIIDDERHIRETIVQALDEHDATAVADAPTALALLDRGETFDVILCDLMMPGMSGADFYDAVERRWPDLLGRILVVTGGAVTPRSKEVLARAVNPPLHKPFRATVLDARIAALLR